MTQSKKTRRALFTSVLSLLACAAMLIGSTFAWFTDSVTSGVNKIVAGNLDVELEYSTDGTTWTAVDENTNLFKPADETLWEPGHTEYVYLRVSNAGSLALKYQFAVNVYGDENGGEENTYTNKNNEPFKLSEYLVFTQTEGAETISTRESLWIADAEAEKAAMGKLDGLSMSGVLLPEAQEKLTLAVYMPTQVGNEANQLTSAKEQEGEPTIYLGLTLNAMQTPHEEDSFGEDYDKNADGKSHVSSGEEIYTAFANAKEGDVIVLDDNLTMSSVKNEDGSYKGYLLVDNVTIDLNGKTITSTGNMYSFCIYGNNVTVKNGTITGNVSYPVTVSGNKKGVKFENITVESGGIGLYGPCEASFTNVKALNTQWHGLWLEGGAVANVFAGCEFYDPAATSNSTINYLN